MWVMYSGFWISENKTMHKLHLNEFSFVDTTYVLLWTARSWIVGWLESGFKTHGRAAQRRHAYNLRQPHMISISGLHLGPTCGRCTERDEEKVRSLQGLLWQTPGPLESVSALQVNPSRGIFHLHPARNLASSEVYSAGRIQVYRTIVKLCWLNTFLDWHKYDSLTYWHECT